MIKGKWIMVVLALTVVSLVAGRGFAQIKQLKKEKTAVTKKTEEGGPKLAKNTIDYIEWYVTDLNRAKKFYGGLFGWRFEKFTEDYLIFHPKEGIGGGIMKKKEVKTGQSPVVYVAVDEIEPYLKKAEKLGGGVAVPKTEIPNSGWFAWITDPDGNIVGIFKALERK